SQTLVKDFLTGLFIVIENTIAVGDVVRIGDHSGVVEAMTVRTLRMRDMDGAVHILPFSEVSQIINMTKDFAYALFNINVAYDTNLRRAMEVIRDLGEELRQDSRFRSSIIDPIEILGVDKFGDSAITIVARIRTRPARQWDVKRAFLLSLKERFDAEKIEIPYPTVTQLYKGGMSSEDLPDRKILSDL
ncbi:MAG: mechanosensitive ion channel family protein, partial [Bdellovibrionales bacterium]